MIERKIASILRKKKKTLAIAESCTGGLVAHRITNIPGSSKFFVGGVIAYSNAVKISVLKVPKKTLKQYGAVSRQVALSMAKGVKRALNADIAAAVTGIAGPAGGTKKKPVGLAYIALVSDKTRKTRKVNFKGDRELIKQQFSEAVLELIKENI